jgi:hypothetical protein
MSGWSSSIFLFLFGKNDSLVNATFGHQSGLSIKLSHCRIGGYGTIELADMTNIDSLADFHSLPALNMLSHKAVTILRFLRQKNGTCVYVVLGCRYQTPCLSSSNWCFLRIACSDSSTYIRLLTCGLEPRPDRPLKFWAALRLEC